MSVTARPRRVRGGFLLLVLAAACDSGAEPTSPATGSRPPPPQPTEWQAVSVTEARALLDAAGTDTLTFIDKRAVGAMLRRVTAGTDGEPFAPLPNVVYHVIEGEARLDVGVDTTALVPGTTVFVRGREERAFRAVTSDLLLLALYTTARPGLDDPRLSAFSRERLLETKRMSRNVLFRAVEAESMTVGAFMLPRQIGGDLLVRHGVDELKYVIRGGGTIETGPDIIPVETGFVVFIDGSLTHRFTRIWQDLDVLFVWDR